jgi:magnesium chelatase subunit I
MRETDRLATSKTSAAKSDAHPSTLGALHESGYEVRTVKDEMRANLLGRLASEQPIFDGIIGYDDTVLPSIENAILAGQDICFLGERGQAKTRLARSLNTLLDTAIPVVKGGELNDDPFAPISPYARQLVSTEGDQTPIDWLPRDRRYTEKLATPDITIADLIGEVDPIKVAEGRYLADETTIHYGLVPRANRGIFAINELPDLAERIQVGLLNILEERDVQVRGYTLRLPLDLFVVASANPEDYTSRGRIITPLKDRLGSQIRTHYPHTIDDEIQIMLQERTKLAGEGIPELIEPAFMLELIAELSQLARRSPDVSQRSGVSVRVSIANLETVSASAVKRAVRLGEKQAAPRISDLPALVASTAGKVELETLSDEMPEERVVDRLLARAIHNVFARYLDVNDLDEIVEAFEAGLVLETGDLVRSADYVRWLRETPGFDEAVARLGGSNGSSAVTASAIEFILEGLHLNRRLNKDRSGGGGRYRR